MADEKLRLLLEQRGAEQLETAVEGILKTVAATQAEIDRFQKRGGLGALAVGTASIEEARARASQLGIELLTAADRARELAIQIASAPESELPRLTREYADLEAQIAAANAEIRRMPRDLRESVNDAVGAFGDVDSALAQIGSSLTGLGTSPLGRLAGGGIISGAGPLAGVGGVFQAGSDVFALTEALPRLSAGLQQVKANTLAYITSAGQQAIANSALAASAASTVAPLGSTASSLAAVAVAAAPLVAATAAIAGGAFLLNKEFQRGGKAVQEYIATETNRIETMKMVRQEIENLSKAEVEARIRQLELEIETQKQLRDGLIATYAEEAEKIDGLSKGANLLGIAIDKTFGTGLTTLGDVVNQTEIYNQAIAKAETQLEIYKGEILKEVEARERLNELQQSGRTEAERFIQLLKDRVSAEIEFNEQLETLTAEGAKRKLAELQQQKTLEEQMQAAIGQAIEENNRVITEGLEQGLPEDTFADIIEQNKALYQEYSRLGDSIELLSSQTNDFENAIIPSIERREAETAALERQQEALDELTRKEEELTRAREESLDKLSSLQQQIADAQAEFADKESLRTAEDSLKQSREAEDALFKQRIEAAKAAEQSRLSEQRLIDARQELNTKTGEINRKFMTQELKRSQEFTKAEARISDDANRERLRKLEDFNRQLSEAAEENDVRAFIRLQRQRNTELTRDTEDLDTERRRRLEDFLAQQEESRQQRAQELADLRAHHEQRRAQELAARTEENSEVARIEAEWARVRERREVEDQQRRIQLERDAFNKRIELLKVQEQQLSAQIGLINASIARNTYQTIVASAMNALSQVRQSMARDLRPTRPVINNSYQNVINNTVGDVITSADLRKLQNVILGAVRPTHAYPTR